jgi:hypothetical protein
MSNGSFTKINTSKLGNLSEPETVSSFFTGDVNMAMQNAQIFITTYVGLRNNRAASDKARKVDQRSKHHQAYMAL